MQAQMLTPQNRTPRLSQRSSRRISAVDTRGIASVPYMIGDSGAGTCVSFSGLLEAELSHPTLACSRLNISENNSAMPTDRLYFSYRHFHNATPTRFFQYEQDFSVDRYTLGGEKTFWDGMMSFEVRVPLENRLTSNPFYLRRVGAAVLSQSGPVPTRLHTDGRRHAGRVGQYLHAAQITDSTKTASGQSPPGSG